MAYSYAQMIGGTNRSEKSTTDILGSDIPIPKDKQRNLEKTFETAAGFYPITRASKPRIKSGWGK